MVALHVDKIDRQCGISVMFRDRGRYWDRDECGGMRGGQALCGFSFGVIRCDGAVVKQIVAKDVLEFRF